MSEWQQVTLHEVCSFKRGLSYSGSDVKEDTPSGIPFITIKNFHKGGGFNFSGFKKYIGKNHADFTVSPGDLLIANTDVTRNADIIGSAIIAPEVDGDIAFSMDVTHLDVDKNKASPAFVCYRLLLDDAREHMKGASAGSTVLHLNLKQASAFPFKIPTKSEQKVIARILDTLDTQIQKTEALIAKLENVKEGLLHDLLTRGIDENGQLRPSPEQAPELYKESPLGLIPREWSIASLGGVSEIVSGVTLGSKSGNSAWPLVPYLRVANVQDGYLDLSEIKLVRVNPDHIEKYRLHPGDVLMNEGGDFDKLGRGTLWRGEIELCVHQNHVFRVRTDGRVLDPYFLASFSASFAGKRYFVKSSKQSTNLASINSTQLKAFEVPLPSIEEQGVIVDKLQVMADRIEHEKSHLSKLAAHKSGLMDDLLTGRVRVTRLLDQAQAQGTTPA